MMVGVLVSSSEEEGLSLPMVSVKSAGEGPHWGVFKVLRIRIQGANTECAVALA